LSDDATTSPSEYGAALDATGMTRQTAHRYQALADVPEDIFNAALRGPDRATARGILRDVAKPQPRVSREALWLWGRLKDFEREGYLTADPDELFAGMTESMWGEVCRLAPLVANFLSGLPGGNHDSA